MGTDVVRLPLSRIDTGCQGRAERVRIGADNALLMLQLSVLEYVLKVLLQTRFDSGFSPNSIIVKNASETSNIEG
jgi:hypothetical protein